MEKLLPPVARRFGRGMLLLGALGFGAVACANWSGNGNEFIVKGRVTDAGDESLKAEIYEIVDDHGEADGWFEIGAEHRLHDNCECHGAWTGKKQYGQVYDYEDNIIEPSQVALGSCVEFIGKIRSDKEGKSWDYRPVYDSAQLTPC